MVVSIENKVIAERTLDVFGGKPNVSKYWDNDNTSSIDILTTTDGLYDGVVSCATVGLSDYSIGYTVDGKPLRVEIVGAGDMGFDFLPNIIATCAFNVINSKFRIYHGEVFNGVVGEYYPECDMEHIMFVSPFLWGNLRTIEFPDKTVTWLLAIPVSSNEYQYAGREGVDALEDLFEKKGIDVFDLKRGSVL